MSGTLILVPGLNCTRRLFEPQIEALLRSRTVLVADNTKDELISAMASRLLAGAPERFALAGLSMGGYVALDVLRQAPGRVEALALLDTTARPDSESSRDSRERLIALAESGQFEQVHSLLWPRLVAPARLRDRSLEATVLGMMRDTGPEAFVRQERAIMARRDFATGPARDRDPDIGSCRRRRCHYSAGARA